MLPVATAGAVAAAADPATNTLLGALAVIALIGALVGRELAAAAGPPYEASATTLVVTIAPLLVVFGVIVLVRLAPLL